MGDGFSELAPIDNSTLGARFSQRVANLGKLTVEYLRNLEFNASPSNR